MGENYVCSVQPMINNGFTVLDKLRQQINIMNKYGDLIKANKDFEYKVMKKAARQIPNGGQCTTTCLTCNAHAIQTAAFRMTKTNRDVGR